MTQKTETTPNEWTRLARQIAAQLIPHTTSVKNVELISKALEEEYHAGCEDGKERERRENGTN